MSKMKSTILVKNATLWQWDEGKCGNIRGGSAVRQSWLVIDKGVITNSSSNLMGSQEKQPPPEVTFGTIIDVKHQLVIPGLHDAHIHVAMTGESNYFLNLKDCSSIENLIKNLSEHSAKFPKSVLPWISGINWDQSELGRYPSRQDLDEACPDRPVFLWRACWHIGVANTAALQLARVMNVQHCLSHESNSMPTVESSSRSSSRAAEEPLLVSPPGGLIDLGGDGCPTGILRERAVELVVAVMGKKSPGELERFISEGLRLCLRMGLTSVQTNDVSSLAVYKKLCEGDSLPIRVFLTPNYEELAFDEQSASPALTAIDLKPYRPACMPASSAKILLSNEKQPATAPGNTYTSVDYSTAESRLIVERVKIYADGSLGAETAALKKQKTSLVKDAEGTDVEHALCESSEAHGKGNEEEKKDGVDAFVPESMAEESVNYSGILSHTSSELKSMVSRARSVGHRVEVHAIGDAAAEQVLDAFDAAGVHASERPVLTHCQVLDSNLIGRMVTGGVIANVQPSFVPTDMRWVQQRLSPVQLQYSYAWKTLLDRGVCVAGGSDAPIETCSPLVGMFDAIHRQARSPSASAEGSNSSSACLEPEVFRPEEALTFSEALWIYTVGAAYAAGCELFLGSLEVNFAADFVVLDASVLQDHSLLGTTKPKMVVVGGQVSFSEANFLSPYSEPESPSEAEKAVPLCGAAAMGGPYVPGKNGKRVYTRPRKPEGEGSEGDVGVGRLVGGVCACRLLGRYCAAAYS